MLDRSKNAATGIEKAFAIGFIKCRSMMAHREVTKRGRSTGGN